MPEEMTACPKCGREPELHIRPRSKSYIFDCGYCRKNMKDESAYKETVVEAEVEK